jgi:hypothetical protein
MVVRPLVALTVMASGLVLAARPAWAAPDHFVVNRDHGGSFGACLPERCTLTDALVAADQSPNLTTITFDIPDPDPIVLESGFGLHYSTVIDGTTQPGYSDHPIIELDLSQISGDVGFVLVAGDNRVELRGLAIYGAEDTAIGMLSQSGNVLIEEMFIGTDGTGTQALGNGHGIVLFGPEEGPVTIRDNLISGNDIGIIGSLGSDTGHRLTIAGNRIGTDITGTVALPNRWGVDTCCAVDIVDNLISGNTDIGLYALGGAGVIQRNIIGLDATGTEPLGNGRIGLWAPRADDFLIGGPDPADGNIVSANSGHGIVAWVRDLDGAQLTIQNNVVGTDAEGTADFGNGKVGIRLGYFVTEDNPRTATVVDNVVAFNGGPGVGVDGLGGERNVLRRNRIYANEGLGIDLWPPGDQGVTPNDATDADTGPNELQNFPVLTSARARPAGTIVSGRLSSTPSTPFVVDLYRVPSCDPSGHGEGAEYLGETVVQTDTAGEAAFRVVLPPVTPGDFVTATATRQFPAGLGGTSEFSACLVVQQSSG